MLHKIEELIESPETSSFINALNQDIQALNLLIDDYNSLIKSPTPVSEHKQQQAYFILLDLIAYLNKMENQTAPKDLEKNVAFRRKREGFLSSLSQEIANYQMLAEHADEFTSQLVQWPPEELFQLSTHLLKKQNERILGCELEFSEEHHNSLSFTITQVESAEGRPLAKEAQIPSAKLRLSDLSDCAHKTVFSLKNSELNNSLLPITGSRQQLIKKAGHLVILSMSISPYFIDLLSWIERHHKEKDLISPALSFYTKMCATLIQLGQHKNSKGESYVFPNMQNSNWAYLEGEIFIIDPKSIRHSDKSGDLNLAEFHAFAEECQPPELAKAHSTVSSDQVHAYILGRNLYQFLSQNPKPQLKFNFKHSIFQSAMGKQLAGLIKGLVQEDPRHRLSLDEALKQLNRLERRNDCRRMLATIKSFEITQFGLSATDKHMTSFYKEKMAELERDEQLDSLHAELSKLIDESKTWAALKTITERARELVRFFSNKKLNALKGIDSELRNIPVSERTARCQHYIDLFAEAEPGELPNLDCVARKAARSKLSAEDEQASLLP